MTCYKFIIYFFILIFCFQIRLLSEENKKISGYHFAEPSTQEMQDEDFLNPGVLWVEKGEQLWKKKNSSNQNYSCETCHGKIKNLRGVSLNYPKVDNETNKLVNLEQRINICRTKYLRQKKLEAENDELLSLSTFISYQSRGMKLNIKINNLNKKFFDFGKSLFFKPMGQMGLSCNQCHDDRVGLNLRAEKVSQGQINGFPTYLLRWSKVASVHKRIEFCNEQARAKPFKIFSDEYNALQLYMTWRGNGLIIETPSVRK